jgi:hypothetical protein
MEQDYIKQEIHKMSKQLADFSNYMPSYNLKNMEQIENVKKGIREVFTKKLAENITPIDNRFSIENFEYATKELGSDYVQNIYSMLGPFDFSQYFPEVKDKENNKDTSEDSDAEIDPETAIEMEYNWVKRRSGALYRGEV